MKNVDKRGNIKLSIHCKNLSGSIGARALSSGSNSKSSSGFNENLLTYVH